MEDIVPAKKVVTRYIITRRYCKHCKKQVSAGVPDALPNERFGIRLMTLIGILKTMGLSYGKISQLLQTIYSLNLTESAINHAVFKIAKAFGPTYQEMISELKKEANIHTATRRAGG